MANYNIDIGVVIKGNEKLTKFNSTLKKTTLQVDQLNKFMDEREPWKNFKTNPDQAGESLLILIECF